MYKEYNALFRAVEEYAEAFMSGGYSADKAENIACLASNTGDTPFERVCSVFGFGRFERCAAALGLIASSDARIRLPGVNAVGCITPGVCCAMFLGESDDLGAAECFAEDSPLSRVFDGVRPFFGAALTPKSFFTVFAASGQLSDEAFAADEPGDERFTGTAGSARAESEIKAALASFEPWEPRVICISGESGSGRLTSAKRAFRAAGKEYMTVVFPFGYEMSDVRELASKLLISGCCPVVCEDRCGVSGERLAAYIHVLTEETGLVVVTAGEGADDRKYGAQTINIRTEPPTMREQLKLWESECSVFTRDIPDLEEIVGEFDMTPGGIKKAMKCAAMLSGSGSLTAADIKNGCVRSVNSDMGSKAVKIRCTFGWDDLILPEHGKKLLRAACDRVRYRRRVYDTWGFGGNMPYGRSVSMIFTGPPGTGKTMGAQVIAAELGLDIYRISLANVVSKYIGETEKNLDEIFDKAKRSKVILFFDEADVLFSKRTEVKDSNDKYSNMESAFLLQKIEEYSGIVILATNLVQNFDEAFKRRMQFIIDFPFPDVSRRREIWERVFPEKLPLDGIDTEYLAERFELSGSNIKNIALYSAFLAASDGSSAIEMRHIISALRNEYAKSGKAFTRAEAGEYFRLLDEQGDRE